MRADARYSKHAKRMGGYRVRLLHVFHLGSKQIKIERHSAVSRYKRGACMRRKRKPFGGRCLPTGNLKIAHGDISIAFGLGRLKKTVQMRQWTGLQAKCVRMMPHLFSSPKGGSKRIR